MLKNMSVGPVVSDVEDIDLALLNGEDLFDVSDESSEGLGAVHTKRRRKHRRGKAKAAHRGRKTSKASRKRRARRHAKTMPRSAKGRFMKLSKKHRRHGLRGLEGLADVVLLESEDQGIETGLGKHRRSRKSRKSRRGRRGGVGGLAGLAMASASLADAEVMRSMPVVGLFQYAATRGGLEALGGAAIAPVVSGLVSRGLFVKTFKVNVNDAQWDIASSLTSAVVTWELGKLIGSGSVSKYGAFSILSNLIDRQIVQRWIWKNIPGMSFLGDSAILFPGVRRPDYAVNPLSGFGTVRIPDRDGIGQVRLFENQDMVGLGTVRVPDNSGIGTVRVPDNSGIGAEGDEDVTELEPSVCDDGGGEGEVF